MEGVAFFGYVFTRPRGQKPCWLIKANLSPSLINKVLLFKTSDAAGLHG